MLVQTVQAHVASTSEQRGVCVGGEKLSRTRMHLGVGRLGRPVVQVSALMLYDSLWHKIRSAPESRSSLPCRRGDVHDIPTLGSKSSNSVHDTVHGGSAEKATGRGHGLATLLEVLSGRREQSAVCSWFLATSTNNDDRVLHDSAGSRHCPASLTCQWHKQGMHTTVQTRHGHSALARNPNATVSFRTCVKVLQVPVDRSSLKVEDRANTKDWLSTFAATTSATAEGNEFSVVAHTATTPINPRNNTKAARFIATSAVVPRQRSRCPSRERGDSPVPRSVHVWCLVISLNQKHGYFDVGASYFLCTAVVPQL